jgi:ribonuclease G
MIIEQTEALHVIDVNSGNRSKSPDGQEANALDVNLGAADEIARQLRLRDLGGIIVIDFIDMAMAENRQKLYERMCQNMQNDRAKHNILPLSKFGLMQLTRQRVRPAMNISVEEECPTCGGTGKIKASLLFIDVIEHKIELMAQFMKGKKFYLHIHPFVEAYINRGIFSRKLLWKLKYGFGVNIIPNQKLSFLEYKFYDNKQNEINLQEENTMN